MRKTFKKSLAFLIAVIMILSASPIGELSELDMFSIKAEAATYSGMCGDNLTWTLDADTGELLISGTGDMTDWVSFADVPWYSERSIIKTVVLSDGVTSIGSYAFYVCYFLTDVYYTGDFAGWCSIKFSDNPYSNPMHYADNLYIDGTLISGNIVIPDSVTSIGDHAFEWCNALTGVTIPDGVTSIGDHAFEWCNALKSVTIGGSVTSIGEYAFYCCGDLTSITIPDSVTSIGDYAFCNCSDLTSITIPDSVTSIGDYVLCECDALKSVTIGNSVESIGDYAFYCCDTLTSITIPDGVTSIGDYAFEYCYALKSVTIGDSVESIGDYAFEWCNVLTSVTIGDSVESIGEYAFYNCSDITDVYYTGDPAGWCSIKFSDYYSNPMYYADKLYIDGSLLSGDIVISDGVESIGDYAFYNCSALTSVTIPDGVTSIGSDAFRNCYALTGINIPDGVTSIGDYAFCGCDALKSVTIGDSVESIGDHAFYHCYALTSINIPDSVTSIGDYAFCNCSALTSITIPDGVTRIGDYTFCGCDAFTSVTIPDGVTSIGDFAFGGCFALESVTIGDSVESIDRKAFQYCSALESITIGCSVASIGDDAFSSCSSLTSIIIPDSVTSIGSSAFRYCSSLTGITIPDGVTSIGDYTFSGCSSLTSITIPDGVTRIGREAFYNCSALTDVYYSGTQEQWNKISTVASGNGDLRRATKHYNYVPHEHAYDAVVTAPTCTAGGYTTYTCLCGNSYVENETLAFGHDFGEWVLTTAPTVETDGEETCTCSRCGATRTQLVSKLEEVQKVTFVTSRGKAHPGETVEVTVSITDNPGIVSAMLKLSYDSEVLTLTSVKNGGIFSDDSFEKGNDITAVPYTVLWIDALSTENYTDNGVLLTLTFEVSKDAPEGNAEISISCIEDSIFNSDLKSVKFEVQNGSIEIKNRLSGDANGDNEINLKDVVLIRRYLAGGWGAEIDMSNSDVDGSGDVSLVDVALLTRYLADWEVTLI